jgi:hypothetical protein
VIEHAGGEHARLSQSNGGVQLMIRIGTGRTARVDGRHDVATVRLVDTDEAAARQDASRKASKKSHMG